MTTSCETDQLIEIDILEALEDDAWDRDVAEATSEVRLDGLRQSLRLIDKPRYQEIADAILSLAFLLVPCSAAAAVAGVALQMPALLAAGVIAFALTGWSGIVGTPPYKFS